MDDMTASGEWTRPLGLSVGELMRRDFITVTPEVSVEEARQLMRLARLRHLVVARQGRVVGMLSYRSLMESAIDALTADVERRARPSVATLMVTEPECISRDRPLEEVAAQLFRLGLGCLPVVDGDDEPPALIGIVTERDLLRAAYDPWFRGRARTSNRGGHQERERDTS